MITSMYRLPFSCVPSIIANDIHEDHLAGEAYCDQLNACIYTYHPTLGLFVSVGYSTSDDPAECSKELSEILLDVPEWLIPYYTVASQAHCDFIFFSIGG